MFGFVKNWLRKSEGETSANALPAAGRPKFSATTTARPASARVLSAAAPGVPGAKADAVELPLAAIFGRLPADLQSRAKLPVNGQAPVAIPLGVIVSQLGRGAVRITFGELRQLAGEMFYSQTDRDAAVVELPLAEILARLDPALLPRRAKSAVEIPDEITSPFAGKGHGLNIYKPEPAPVAAINRNNYDPFSVMPEIPAHAPAAFVPPAAEPEIQPVRMATIPAPAALRRAAPAVASQVAAAPAGPSGAGKVLTVTLAELAAAWPAPVRTEIGLMNLTGAKVALPLSLVEESLKKGRAVFAWRQVRSWTDSPAAATVSAHDAELLELPLRVLAPLFLAQLPGVRQSQQRTAVDANIPDLFSGPTKPKPAPPTPAPAEAKPTPIIFSDSEITGKARLSDNPRSGTEFLKRYATPNDIVAKAASLPGVSGALITLADGLLVAAHLPPSLNGDSLAAFTPQLYARASQSAREYRMGELKDLSFTVGDTSWKIFKVGAIFFAAFGSVKDALPLAPLAALAAELDRKPKP